MKLKFIIICIISSMLNISCAIPIQLQVKSSNLEMVRFEYEKQKDLKEWKKKKQLAAYKRICQLRTERIEKKRLLRLPKSEKEIILKAFSDSNIILKAFEKLGCSMFDMAGFLNEYGKNDIDGFCDYLGGWKDEKGIYHEGQYPFNTVFGWWLDREIFNFAKRNYELLKRLERGIK